MNKQEIYAELKWLEICYLENQVVHVTEISSSKTGCEGVNWIQIIQNRV
jgi:hypothetical protein